MATMSEVMRYALDLDVDGFLSGLRKAEKGADDTFDDIDSKGSDTAGRFDGLGGKMGKALVAGFAAVGVGALLMQGINQAMDAQEGVKRLQGQFDLTAQEAKRFGDLAGDLYKEGWGESLEEVQQTFATASKQLDITNSETLNSITEGVLATSKTFGVEFDEVIRAVSQMLENGLAPDAESALDTVVRAFQNGGNQADDLLDTIIEYSQHWSAVGLDGEAALSQVVHGLQNGQRDADKMADAVKEMRIRIVENSEGVRDALDDIGVDTDEVINAFLEGGPAAGEAFETVIKALKDGQDQGDDTSNAVAILGTQFEDLGPKALESLLAIEDQLGEVEGATERLAETVEAAEWEKFKREGEDALTTVGDATARALNPYLESANDAVEGLKTGFGLWGDSAEDAARKTAVANELASEAISESTQAVWDLQAAQAAQGEEAERANALMSEGSEAADIIADEIEKARRTFERFGSDGVENMDDVADATDDAADSASDAERAFAQFIGAIVGREAYRSAVDSIDGYAARVAEAKAELDAGSASAEDYQDTVDRAFDSMASDVLRYVASLDDVPDEVKTEFLATVRTGDVERIEAELAELTRTREIILHYRTEGSTSVPVQPGVDGPFHEGGIVGRPGTSSDDVLALVQNGEGIIDRADMRQLANGGGMSGGGGLHIENLTVNAARRSDGELDMQQVIDALRRYERFNGSGWRSS